MNICIQIHELLLGGCLYTCMQGEMVLQKLTSKDVHVSIQKYGVMRKCKKPTLV